MLARLDASQTMVATIAAARSFCTAGLANLASSAARLGMRWCIVSCSRPTYWSLPGGGIEAGDRSMEAAITREVREEVGGDAQLHGVLTVIEAVGDQHAIFLATIATWSESDRTGPEFADPSRGRLPAGRGRVVGNSPRRTRPMARARKAIPRRPAGRRPRPVHAAEPSIGRPVVAATHSRHPSCRAPCELIGWRG